MKRKRIKAVLEQCASGLLALTMLFGSINATVLAEIPDAGSTPEPTAETLQDRITETPEDNKTAVEAKEEGKATPAVPEETPTEVSPEPEKEPEEEVPVPENEPSKEKEEWSDSFEIRNDGDKHSAEYKAVDTVYRGGIEVTKFDTDRYATNHLGPNLEQGDAKLAGAEYTIYNVSKADDVYDYLIEIDDYDEEQCAILAETVFLLYQDILRPHCLASA